MTVEVVILIIVGIIFIIASFFVTEKFSKRESNINLDLLTIQDNYEFSERELHIIKRKIEDVIAKQAKDILYETDESLSNMANEKTMALGDYAVTVCEEIEKNHKEVMFLYSMLDDKQKEIMNTVKVVDETNKSTKELFYHMEQESKQIKDVSSLLEQQKNTALEQLTALKQQKELEEKRESSLKDIKVTKAVEKTVTPEMTSEPTLESMKEPVILDEIISDEIIEHNDDIFIQEDTEQLDVDLDDVFSQIDETDIDFNEVLEDEFQENRNSNGIILELYKNGESIINIAKQLGLGVGEVKLVVDLYRGE